MGNPTSSSPGSAYIPGLYPEPVFLPPLMILEGSIASLSSRSRADQYKFRSNSQVVCLLTQLGIRISELRVIDWIFDRSIVFLHRNWTAAHVGIVVGDAGWSIVARYIVLGFVLVIGFAFCGVHFGGRAVVKLDGMEL